MNTITHLRTHPTPIPTPLGVRLLGSLLIGLSIAFAMADLPRVARLPAALICAAAAIILALRHPYRRRMIAYAQSKNVATTPSRGQLSILMAWWMVFMLAIIVTAPWWITALVGLVVTMAAFLVFPHADGTRALAYA